MAESLNVGLVQYRTWDPEKSLNFFTQALGFYPHFRGDTGQSLNNLSEVDIPWRHHLPDKIFVGCGETLLEFCRADPDTQGSPQDPGTSQFTVVVDDLDAMLTRIERHGANVVRQAQEGDSFWGREAFIDVPGGPQISLREYRAPDGPHFNGWNEATLERHVRSTAADSGRVEGQALNVGVVRYSPWDPQRTLDFLTDALGFYPQLRGDTVAVGCDETLIQFYGAAPDAELQPKHPNDYAFAVVVDSLDDMLTTAELHGAKIARPTWEGNAFWGRQVVIDVPGAPYISLREYRAPDGPHFDGWYKKESPSSP